MTTAEQTLADALWSARTMEDVDSILEQVDELQGGSDWHPVGNRLNNTGTINMASDPSLALVERITNAMDAVLDLGHLEHPGDEVGSSREAAQQWFGVPREGLGAMSDDERRALGDNVRMTMADSGDDDPTVIFDDRGTGQHPSDFPKTFVSLNESNKVGKAWTLGTYGQGGSVTFRFSRATIILSRRHPTHLDGKSDEVGFTIVRERWNPDEEVESYYEYLRGPEGEILSLDPGYFPELDHGTRVIHVGYGLHRYKAIVNLWQFLHAALFEPLLPFTLSGTRAQDGQYGVRTIKGNRARLDGTPESSSEIQLSHAESITFELAESLGSVQFNYWVLQRPPESTVKGEPTDSFVPYASEAIAMTIFGQRQDTQSRTWIKDQAKLPFLYKNLVVQIDTDPMTVRGRNILFASTRERATESPLKSAIYAELGKALAMDEELKRLNKIEKERRLSKSTATTNEKIRKRLAKFIDTRLKGVTQPGKGGTDEGSGGTRKGTPGSGGSKRDTDDSDFPEVPTELEFMRGKAGDLTKVAEIVIRQGARTTVWVKLDAKNGYLPLHDDDLTTEWSGSDHDGKLTQTTRSKLLGGLSRWVFEADGDVATGVYEFEASLDTADGPLRDQLRIEVKEPKQSKKTSSGQEEATGPDVRWVFEEDWDAHDNMDGFTVGGVDEDDEETIIWVNGDHRMLNKALSNQTPEAAEQRKDRYQFPVAAGLYLQHHYLKSADEHPPDVYIREEQGRLAEAVLAAIEPDDLLEAAIMESEDV